MIAIVAFITVITTAAVLTISKESEHMVDRFWLGITFVLIGDAALLYSAYLAFIHNQIWLP